MGKFTQTDTGARAALVNQAVTYTAVEWGTAGNDITVALVNPGSGTNALAISVIGRAISVALQSTAVVAATASLATTSAITLTSVAAGAARNTQTFKTVVAAAAANPTNTILFAFSGTSAAIVCTITPNDGTNNSATPVTVTSANLTELINTGLVTGKNPTISGTTSFRTLQTATGGNTTVLAAGGNGDNVTATFASGADYAIVTTASALVTALLLDSGVTALVTPSGAGASALVALTATALAGGDESDFTSVTSNLILTQLDTGVYQLALQSAYYALLGCDISVMAASASDLRPQLKSADVVTAKTIVFRLIAGSTPTNMADGNALLVTLKLRNTSS